MQLESLKVEQESSFQMGSDRSLKLEKDAQSEHEEIYHQYDDWNGNQKHDWGPRGPR